jgi:hypothetical protein
VAFSRTAISLRAEIVLKIRSLQFWMLVLAMSGIVLACRTADLLSNASEPRVAQNETVTPTKRAATATRKAPTIARPTRAPTEMPTEILATEPPPPTEAPPPTEPPPTNTRRAAPTKIPPPPQSPTPEGPTATPAPTRCPQQFCVVYRGCQPDAGNTIVEGIVYNNGVPENGVAVRVAKAEGAYPLVDDFVSGTDPINPGQPDPNNPGRYILQIVAGAPREGNWWVFVVDRPNGTKQISEAKLIHTNDDPFNPGNCQHAFVDFVR